MKKTFAILLLVGVVGCGKSEQAQEQPSENSKEAAPATDQKNDNLAACPDCGGKVSKRAAACPHCGAPLTQQARPPEPARPEVPRSGSGQSGQSGNAQPSTGDKTTVNSIGMKLTLIPAGEFQMGSPDAEPDRNDDETQHLVKISKPFYLGVYEVTQQQYEKVMGDRPWQGENYVKKGADYPAVYVSHDDAVEFCRRLSKQEGVEYRLPTEAEREYACRAGTTTAYSFGDDDAKLGQYAWYRKNAWDIGEEYPHGVGQKLPNPWGLYDMHGNVSEWCQDWTAPYGSEKVVSDPMGPAQGERRLLRGGWCASRPSRVRSAYRHWESPSTNGVGVGFRVARTPVAKTPDMATVKKTSVRDEFAKGLIAYYPFNGNALDKSGNKNHGELAGNPVFQEGVEDQALSLDGVDDQVFLNQPLVRTFPFTWSLWIRTRTNPGAGMLLGIQEPPARWSPVLGFSSSTRGQLQKIEFGVDVEGSEPIRALVQPGPERWMHIVVTCKQDGSSAMYFDGILKGQVRYSAFGGRYKTFVIGGYKPTRKFSRLKIDCLRIYARSLSTEEVVQLHKLEKPSDIRQ
jgi:formylglycine-generating enzyme required for sulfatase activity